MIETIIGLFISSLKDIFKLIAKIFFYLRKKTAYQKPGFFRWKYFKGSQYLVTKVYSDKEKQFLHILDLAKRKADDSLIKKIGTPQNTGRLRDINHYVFKIYRDFWFIQQQWHNKRGVYFQGIKTMPDAPECKRDNKVVIPYNLNDQTDDWEDIGYLEEYAPVQLECHPYNSPSGQGFAIMARVNIDGDIWINRLHYGPEKYRNCNNLLWVKEGS